MRMCPCPMLLLDENHAPSRCSRKPTTRQHHHRRQCTLVGRTRQPVGRTQYAMQRRHRHTLDHPQSTMTGVVRHCLTHRWLPQPHRTGAKRSQQPVLVPERWARVLPRRLSCLAACHHVNHCTQHRPCLCWMQRRTMAVTHTRRKGRMGRSMLSAPAGTCRSPLH